MQLLDRGLEFRILGHLNLVLKATETATLSDVIGCWLSISHHQHHIASYGTFGQYMALTQDLPNLYLMIAKTVIAKYLDFCSNHLYMKANETHNHNT